MKLPLIILTICAVGVGFVPFSNFITADGNGLETHIDFVFSIAPVALSVLAIAIAASFYKRANDKPKPWLFYSVDSIGPPAVNFIWMNYTSSLLKNSLPAHRPTDRVDR